ncbi:L,D-transpeptidase [Williamsia maris]|uniref:Lipoprotein-anchoring transpeptidase ErfK/SrfK n=1 Tax=Williamsia maris TaxID=72806 RepID=A0ABT1HAI2_9NOCA|nr:Ig-like domain-containing protein [Williamsia maris]MCP2175255.1 Lipoprotein-anchoring transpeptidase ErfK/SrfK [Williamsia maris]
MIDSRDPVRLTRRGALAALAVGAVGVTAAACSKSDNGGSSTGAAASESAEPTAEISYLPKSDSDANPSPTAEFAVKVSKGQLNPDVKLTNARGTVVTGALSEDRSTYTVTEPLGYGGTYTWSGSAIGEDRKVVPIEGTVTTLTPQEQVNVVVNIADGQEVGIAVPLILKFDSTVSDKKAVERALTVTTTPPTEGSWAWLPEDNGSRAHWRSKEYFAPGTKVSMRAKLYGLNHGDGAYGAADVTSDFVIGRSQIVKADATSFKIDVMQGSNVLMTLPCSYGSGDLDRNVTRSGIHVVSEKHEDFYMSNPAAGYFNIRERFAVRISNNGEFIHANPETTGVQGSSNVTNGCINLSLDNAQQYFNVAIYGDPVEVTNTRIPLSEADGDIYDWTFSWDDWKAMSALEGEVTSSTAPATPSNAPQLSGISTTPPAPARQGPTG